MTREEVTAVIEQAAEEFGVDTVRYSDEAFEAIVDSVLEFVTPPKPMLKFNALVRVEFEALSLGDAYVEAQTLELDHPIRVLNVEEGGI